MDTSRAKFSGFLTLLCAFGLLPAHAADAPADTRHYAFELPTLNMGEQVRRAGVRFNINDGMTEDDLDAVNKVLDDAGASPVDPEGFRELSLSNGTRVKIGGFLVEGFIEDSVEGVHSLPIEFSTKDELSTTEAALVLQLAKAGNLFVSKPDAPDVVATTGQVVDKRFYKLHKQASITADEAALTEWIRKNIPPQAAAEPGN
ncbi:MAG TPA: hypothetical protein VJ303_16490 [Steroidobacteraceae bacterium]|jgi:hypothetical protein|nr:hypothetical protein [Steroidobacteraceae bacterium]